MKSNDKFTKWVTVGFLIAGSIVAIAIAYEGVNKQVQANTLDIETTSQKASGNEIAIVRLQGNVEHILGKVDEIWEEVHKKK